MFDYGVFDHLTFEQPPGELEAAVITGTLSATEGADIAAIAGLVDVTGSEAATEGADTASFSGRVFIQGTLSAIDGADSAVFVGREYSSGTFAATEGADTAAFIGRGYVTGTLSATEGADGAAIAGDEYATGTLAATDGADTAAFVGTSIATISGSLAAIEGADTAAFSGSQATPEVVIEFPGDGVRRKDRAQEDRERHEIEDRERLKAIVRRAHERVTGEPGQVPLTGRVEKKIAKAAVAELQTLGVEVFGLPDMQAALVAIGELIREYDALVLQQELQAQEDEDEAALLFMVAVAA